MIRIAVLMVYTSIAAAQPRYFCEITPGATCDQQVPGAIVSDLASPTQNSFGPFVCTQFWGDGVMTASSYSSFGIVGVDVENTWLGCASFGCGPSLLQISASASHEFDVVFSSPTDDPIDVRMNLHVSGNIQEVPSLYRVVHIRVTGPSANYSGSFGQIDDDASPDVRNGLLSGFDEIVGSNITTPEFAGMPVNTPVRFTLTIWVENAATLVGGGAINFGRGLRLQQTPFVVTGTAPGVSADDIGIDSFGANISGNTYGGAPCNIADFNNDGELNFFDVSAFLTAYNMMDPVADFNGDGMHDFFDVSAFLSAFGAGCP